MEFFFPDSHPTPKGHYTPAVKAGGLIFISGQLPMGLDASTPVAEQVKATLERLKVVAESAGGKMKDVVKTTVFITAAADWAEVNEAYAAFFGDHKPARSIVPVKELNFEYKVEIEAVLWVG
jgi:2-iminobutanoate/2-iminopropanoate deaminase